MSDDVKKADGVSAVASNELLDEIVHCSYCGSDYNPNCDHNCLVHPRPPLPPRVDEE